MASNKDLLELFQAVGRGDGSTLRRQADAIVDGELRKGNHRVAARLRRALQEPERAHSSEAIPGLLFQEPAGGPLADLKLKPTRRTELEELVAEHRYASDLREAGVAPRSLVLFSGPPGTGKTVTARALGFELSLPVVSLRLSAVLGSYLGQTGGNLGRVFEYVGKNRCILLLDEFDALGRRRGSARDIGEVDRVVVTLLQEFDHRGSDGLLVAATNLPSSIDPAVERRFELRVAFSRPTAKEKTAFLQSRCRELSIARRRVSPHMVEKADSFAALDQLVRDAVRKKVLSER